MLKSELIFDTGRIFGFYEYVFKSDNVNYTKRRIVVPCSWKKKELEKYLWRNVKNAKISMGFSGKILCLTNDQELIKYDEEWDYSSDNFIDRDWRDMGYYVGDAILELAGEIHEIEVECIAPNDMKEGELIKRIRKSTTYDLKIGRMEHFSECWLKK
ncbi:TPA: hypothetical protein OUB70_002261 [Enterococcus faecalis]|nr:hypothetical protein [Enterococcus faecalis]